EEGDVAHAYDVDHGQWEPLPRPPAVAARGLVVSASEFLLVGSAEDRTFAAGLPRARAWTLFVAG
ncbi:MAG: hypothetical protein M3389_01670, partial [Actinomycetota bacterium]|nr:hypothetical protein [Actinomycetota bacterium]